MNDSDRKRISKRLQEMDAAAARLKAAQRLGIGTPATAPPYAQGRSSAAQGDKRFGSKAIARVQKMAARPAGPPTSAVEGAKRGAGLGARAVARGVTGLADIVSPLSRIPYYLATGDVVPSVTESADTAMTKMGLPTPSGTAEQSISGLTSALTGGVGFGGGSMLTANAARSAGPVVAGATRALADMPFRQVLGSLTGEGSRQIAEASGAGPIGQTAAALAGGMVPFAGMRGPAMPRRPTAIPEAPAPLRVAPPAATPPSLDALDPIGLGVDTRRPNLARFPRRDLPAPSIMDLTPDDPAYAAELARISALEAQVGTPGLAPRDAQFIRRHRVQEGPTPPAPQTAPLNMSQAGRMARAKEWQQSKNTNPELVGTRVFRGVGTRGGRPILPDLIDPERAKYRTSAEGQPIVFVTESPDLASEFADIGPTGLNDTGAVFPLMVRGEMFDARNTDHVMRLRDSIKQSAFQKDTSIPLPERQKYLNDAIDNMFAAAEDTKQSWQYVETLKGEIQDAGFDGFRMTEQGKVTFGIFDPKNIRSVNAAFDPAKANSSNILYSGFDPTLAGKLFGKKPQPLDMSQEARMARAKAMGFDTEKKLYHGTIEDFESFNAPSGNSGLPKGMTAMSDSPEVANSYLKPPGPPTRKGREIERELRSLELFNMPNEWFDFNGRVLPRFEKQHAAWLERRKSLKKAAGAEMQAWKAAGSVSPGQVMALYHRTKNPLRHDFEGRKWTQAMVGPMGSLKKYRAGRPARVLYGDIDPKTGLRSEMEVIDINQLAATAKKDGYDSLIAQNVVDYGNLEGAMNGVPATTVLAFDPKNIRSVNAAFDPAKADSSDLLAGIAGLAAPVAVGTGAALTAPKDDAQTRIKKRLKKRMRRTGVPDDQMS